MVHIHSGILLSHTKEHIWVSSNEVDDPRAYYTEWSKSEREIPMTDSCWGLTENNKILYSNYTSIKK